MTKTTSIFTMIGGIDLIGEWDAVDTTADFIDLKFPCTLQMQSPNNLTINNMLRDSKVLTGNSIMINMKSVLWIGQPTSDLKSAYAAARAGLLVARPAVNQ